MSGMEKNISVVTVQKLSKLFIQKNDIATKIAGFVSGRNREEKVAAVDNVSFSVSQGEVVGLVGESGCGKSTLGRMIGGILSPTSGSIIYRGVDFEDMHAERHRKAMLEIQIIFQDPFAALNPRMRIGNIIGEAPILHSIIKSAEASEYVDDILERCGLSREFKKRYPHQCSGGQLQRVGIARALAVNPKFIVCDEVVSALDVSIRAQIINLLMQLRADLNLSYLFISHDVSVVEHISDRILVMYLGKIVEIATTEDIFHDPNHPYSQILLREVPRLENRHYSFKPVKGEIPSPLNPPTGCSFHPRCPYAMKRCQDEMPSLRMIANNRYSACHLNE
jgi:peptide/nickel transport system ATP-binding protein